MSATTTTTTEFEAIVEGIAADAAADRYNQAIAAHNAWMSPAGKAASLAIVTAIMLTLTAIIAGYVAGAIWIAQAII